MLLLLLLLLFGDVFVPPVTTMVVGKFVGAGAILTNFEPLAFGGLILMAVRPVGLTFDTIGLLLLIVLVLLLTIIFVLASTAEILSNSAIAS